MNRYVRISMVLFFCATNYTCQGMDRKKGLLALEHSTISHKALVQGLDSSFLAKNDESRPTLLNYAKKGLVACIFATGVAWTAKHIDKGNFFRSLLGLGVTWKSSSYLFGSDKVK
jgi:hypothetical protein